ncbi:MAG TPA: hypothetical protein VMX16_17590 [Terriglobia bacterium]|nr:hypothetical protein [Terriglobia bacterium]
MSLSRRHTLKILAASASLTAAYPALDGAWPPRAPLPSAGQPVPGEVVNLATFGRSKDWDGNPGIEWDEPRDVWRVEIDFAGSSQIPANDRVKLEYWVSTWPEVPGGGWTTVDDPWQGSWREVHATRDVKANTLSFVFQPLSEAENPNARNAPGYTPSFRRTLKIRLNHGNDRIPFKDLRAYSNSRWASREISVETGCEGTAAFEAKATVYNGIILDSSPLEGAASSLRLKVLYTQHEPSSNDRTILTIHGARHAFGAGVDDVIQNRGVYVKPLGVFLGDATAGESFDSFSKSGRMRPGEDIISRVSRRPEQSLEQAIGEIPRLALTSRKGSHPFRYIPLGFTGSREKYGLDFNGNVFISKKSSKAMKEDLERMLWQGDEIYFRLGTGTVPDFRERETGTNQKVLNGYLPLVTTRWESEGIHYTQQAYATMLEAPLDSARLRGDEPSILFLGLEAQNMGAVPAEAKVWFQTSPAEHLEFKEGLLLGTGNAESKYNKPRLRAVLEVSAGELRLESVDRSVESPIPPPDWPQPLPSTLQGGGAAVWTVPLTPNEAQTLNIKITFRSMQSEEDFRKVQGIHFDTRLQETLTYWKKVTAVGMEIKVPDSVFNTFFRAVLQHILVSQEKDLKTGYTLCPCGTYDYNVFANETDVQVRLLNMRGLHDEAWRCLQPLLELQGSKPFPGRSTDTAAELHGVRVDAQHDYTMGGYNLDHGWTLWTLAEHFLFTRDQRWLEKVNPHLLRAANWIIDQRKATMRWEPDGGPAPNFGLLPAGDLEDVGEWEHWFAVNGYAYRGLNATAGVVSVIDQSEGERLKKEAEAYRKDIRSAAFRAMAIAPVVPLRDGTFVPMIPPRTSLHGRDLGWIRNTLYGAHALVDCGVLSPHEAPATWTLQDYEDNLFMAEDALSIPNRDWFNRGGMALQPNLVDLFDLYLERDQLPQAIRAFYNDFAISFYPDVHAFTEWVPTLGIGGGPFFKTSDEAAFLTWLRLLLIREHEDQLYLNSGAPRRWFLPDLIIEVQRAATYFGELSYRVEAHPEQGVITAEISTPQRNRPAAINLRLRHPQGKTVLRVEVNDKPWERFDRRRELISLPPEEKQLTVRAIYE